MDWPYEIAERDHDIQNPTSAEKIQLLGEYIRLDAGMKTPEMWDAALCLGAAFVWGNIGDAAAAMVPAVKRGGFVAIGEPYWKTPSRVDDGYVDLAATVDRFTATGLALTGIIAASEDDWDRYESPHWRAMEEWLATQSDAHDLRAQHERRRREHLIRREQLGWAIFVGMIAL